MRKSLFAPYLPQASIPPLLAAGKLVIGTLRVNKRNRSDAYVATDVLDSDIYICGSKDRNRALEGDIVAVELLDVSSSAPLPLEVDRMADQMFFSPLEKVDEVWGTKKDKEEKKRKKEEQASFDPRASRDLRKLDKKKDDVEVEGQGMTLFEEEEVNDEQKPQFAGHVVAVLERAPGQLFSGMLGVLRPSSAATQQKQDAERREREGVDLRASTNGGGGGHSGPPPKIIWFRPTDKRVPLIAIREFPLFPFFFLWALEGDAKLIIEPIGRPGADISDGTSAGGFRRKIGKVRRPALRRVHQAVADLVVAPVRTTRRGARPDRRH